jgi:Cytochrome c7 and related cytochrome c
MDLARLRRTASCTDTLRSVYPPLYPRWSNAVYRLAILALAGGAAAAVIGPMLYVRSAYNTNQFVAYQQPVEFDHRHHVRDNGIECLYCHWGAERSPNAGVPTTGVCMGCHAQVWNTSPLLEPVRRSYITGVPISWKRVHDLPDFVYFDHSVHVHRGVACETCHGDVGRMARVEQVQPLTMGWCLDCHREAQRTSPPSPPARDVPDNAWSAAVAMFAKSVARDRDVTTLTSCSACHR